MPEENPLLFISHKANDADIASKLAEFIKAITGGHIDIYLSSNNKYKGPRVGENINSELKNALKRAGKVVLVYSSNDQDWSWCMWECGLAEDIDSPDNKTIVVQCTKDAPSIFQSALGVKLWEEESILGFAQEFLKPDFFEGHDKPLCCLDSSRLIEEANRFRENISTVIPRNYRDEWNAWPSIQLSIERDEIDAYNAHESQGIDQAREFLSKATVENTSVSTPGIFGLVQIDQKIKFGELVEGWLEAHLNRELRWLKTMADQIASSANKKIPNIQVWHRIRKVSSTEEYAIALSYIQNNGPIFNFFFNLFLVTKSPPVTYCMIPVGSMYYLDLGKKDTLLKPLESIVKELEEMDLDRVPLLRSDKIKGVIHIKSIYKLMSRLVMKGGDQKDFTLEHFIRHSRKYNLLEKKYVIVSEDMSVTDTEERMEGVLHCHDAFITKSGNEAEPVIGRTTTKMLMGEKIRSTVKRVKKPEKPKTIFSEFENESVQNSVST